MRKICKNNDSWMSFHLAKTWTKVLIQIFLKNNLRFFFVQILLDNLFQAKERSRAGPERECGGLAGSSALTEQTTEEEYWVFSTSLTAHQRACNVSDTMTLRINFRPMSNIPGFFLLTLCVLFSFSLSVAGSTDKCSWIIAKTKMVCKKWCKNQQIML